MKISVVTDENSAELVANISRYANSQNKVNEADLSANHPYHVRIEQLSKTNSSPALNGQQFGTYWYYERARGSYAQETHKATMSTKKNFEARYPKKQKFDKTELAKLVNIFSGCPHIASAGGQKAFVNFMQDITKEWDRSPKTFGPEYFKRLICYKILFRETDYIVKSSEWYGSYKANIVAYTLSKLFDIIEKRYKDKSINFNYIWKNQNISPTMRKQLKVLTKSTHDYLIDDTRDVQNVTEWAKKTNCWDRFKMMPFPLEEDFIAELVLTSDLIAEGPNTMEWTEDQAMIEVSHIDKSLWNNLKSWSINHRVLTQKELDFVDCAIKIHTKGIFPSGKQCIKILETLNRARLEGFPE